MAEKSDNFQLKTLSLNCFALFCFYFHIFVQLLVTVITQKRPCNMQRFFKGCKNDFFFMKFNFFFFFFAQNIDCGYTLEQPH